MKAVDFVYYCIFAFVSRTPDRQAADAWPIAFISLSLWVHALSLYFLLTRFFALEMMSAELMKALAFAVMIAVSAALLWHYVLCGNGNIVTRVYAKREGQRRYARIGFAMFMETLSLPFLIVGLVILSQ